MSFYSELLLNIILILFPIFIYLLYVAYSNNTNKKKNEFIFDFLCLTSVYLLIKYKVYLSNICFLLLINVPLVLVFLRKRYKCAFILSAIIVIYYGLVYRLDFLLVAMEYLFYFIFFLYFGDKKKNNDFFTFAFIFFKGIILSFEIFYILPKESNFSILVFQVLFILLMFYIVLNVTIYLLEKGEQILSLNKVLKELEKEKVLRNSLFKLTHEIKNPIAVCKGYLDMINYQDLKKAEKYNGIVKKEIDRTLTIMDEFLDYTKVKVNLEHMDIVMLLEDTVSSIKTLLKTKNIKLIVKIPNDEIYINGDYNKLKQVLVNILKNSMEAINHDDGVITISLSNKKRIIHIIIEDNGVGMSKEVLGKVDEMFFTTKEKGTGLGIPLSQEIIKLHEGKLNYESVEGKKTKVSIILQKKNIGQK